MDVADHGVLSAERDELADRREAPRGLVVIGEHGPGFGPMPTQEFVG